MLEVLLAAAALGPTSLSPGLEARLRRGQIRAHPMNFLVVNLLIAVIAAASAATGFFVLGPDDGLTIWSICALGSVTMVVLTYLRLRSIRSTVSYRSMVYLMAPVATVEGLVCGLYAAAVGPDSGYFYYIIIGASSGALVMGGLAYMYTPPLALWYTLVAGFSFGLHQSGRGLEGVLWIIFALLYVVILNLMLFIWFRSQILHFTVREVAASRQRIIENLLSDFEENASDWLWEVDEHLHLTHVGPRMAEVVKRPVDDLLGTYLVDLFDPMHAGTSSLLKQMAARRGFRRLDVGVHAAGCKLTVWELSGQPIESADGHPAGYRGVGSDVTERIALDQLRLSEERYGVLSRVSAGLAHDFNNMLQLIVANLDLLPMSGPISEVQSAAVSRAKEAVARAGRVTGQLLAYTRQEVLVPRNIELEPVVRRIAVDQAELAKVADVEVDIPSGLVVRADPDLFDRAVVNIVKNACEACGPEGAVRVMASEYTDNDGTDVAILQVRDNGPGFPEADLDMVTEPFFTTKQAQGGSGLGLSLAAGFARQSGGSLQVGNDPDGGARIRLALPAIGTATAAVKPPRRTFNPTLVPAPVLVIEDEETVAVAISNQLQAQGFSVTVAHTLGEGLRHLAEGNFKYAVIDLVLPDGSGLKAVREAQSLDVLAVAMTGYRGFDLSDSDVAPPVLRKPFQLGELLDRLVELQESPASAG